MYDNPAGLIAGCVIMWLLTVSAVGLRFNQKLLERKKILISDWLILIGWVFGTGLTVLEIYGIAIKSLGYRIGATLLDPTSVTGQMNKARHIQMAFFLIGVVALGLIKLSVCFLYWQIFGLVTLRRFLIFWMIIITTWTASFVMAGLLECGSHLKAVFGTPTEYLAHCGHAVPAGYAMVASDILTDFVTLIIPIPIILRMQMPIRKKLLVLMAFLIGALSVGASIAKGYIYIRSSKGQYTEDGLIVLTGISMWNLAEVEIGIIAASGPLLRPALARLFSPLTSLISLKPKTESKSSNLQEPNELGAFQHMPSSKTQLTTDTRSKTGQYELNFGSETTSIEV